MATTATDDAQPPIDLAVAFYKERSKAGDPISFRACAARFGVNRETLRQHTGGRATRIEANSNMSHFTPEEDQVLIKSLIEIAEQGFPDSKRYLEERVNTLLRAKLGDPTFCIGVHWVHRWLERHKGHLQKYWNTSLDSTRANAVNPPTVSDYFSKLKKVLIEHNIEPDCLWSMDETGLQFNHTPKKRVIGPAGKHQQHSIRSGTRDFATIIPLISAAGACPAPTVIFQGVRLNTSWTGLGNPLNAS